MSWRRRRYFHRYATVLTNGKVHVEAELERKTFISGSICLKACGHTLCKEDYRKLGGSLPGDAAHAERTSNSNIRGRERARATREAGASARGTREQEQEEHERKRKRNTRASVPDGQQVLAAAQGPAVLPLLWHYIWGLIQFCLEVLIIHSTWVVWGEEEGVVY